MTPQDEALKQLADEARRYTRAQRALDLARERTTAAIVEALKTGARPTDVDRLSPFTPTYNRRKAREAGVGPSKSGS